MSRPALRAPASAAGVTQPSRRSGLVLAIADLSATHVELAQHETLDYGKSSV